VRGRSTRPPLVHGRTQPSSKRPIDLPRSAATCEGGGGTVPPHCPPAHARAASGTSVRLLSPCTRSACDRGPPALMPAWHALLLALAARLQWPSCWCAQRTPCVPGVAARMVASAPAVRPRASLRRSQPQRSGRPGLDAGALRQYSASVAWREESRRGTGAGRATPLFGARGLPGLRRTPRAARLCCHAESAGAANAAYL
jgi:hypothetical protein